MASTAKPRRRSIPAASDATFFPGRPIRDIPFGIPCVRPNYNHNLAVYPCPWRAAVGFPPQCNPVLFAGRQ